MGFQSRSLSARWIILSAIAALAPSASGCAGDATPGGTAGSGPTTTGTGGQGGGQGGQGGTATGGGGAGGTSGGGGQGGALGCQSDGDCMGDPAGAICNTDTGLCVACLPDNDVCAQGQYCDPNTLECVVGCTDDADCGAGSGLVCNPATHQCVGCVNDAGCPVGSICSAGVCVPGCSPMQPCQPGFSCCGTQCFDLSDDEIHCGDCSTICQDPPNAESLCVNGQCTQGVCDAPYEDCNGDPMDGCERNTLQDGPCVCTPGATQSCYQGAPGTEGVGPCAAGARTCLPSGVGWGPCLNQVLPTYEICGNGVDEDCNGTLDDGSDEDGDGWTYCNGDCCDSSSDCGTPGLVNPGAFEFVGNNVDDDCDAATSDTTPVVCTSAQKFAGVTGLDVAAAMELCQTTIANPPLPQKKWGIINAQQLLANGTTPSATQLSNMQNNQTAVLVNYGTGGVVPQLGATMAGISSGKMRDEGDTGYAGSSTSYASNSQPPMAYLAAHNNALPTSVSCNGTNCPAGSGANDSVNVRLTIRVPTNAQSFSYKFRFFSYEYWIYSCTSFNDFYLALLQSGAANIPADKNISFDSLGNPVSVNNGFFDVCTPKTCYTCPSGTTALQGTGMQVGNNGGATNWLTTDAPIVPGETIQLEFMVFDVSDTVLDSLTLLDAFTWNIAPAQVGTHE